MINNKRIIGISGKAGSGKDEFVKILNDTCLKLNHHSYTRISFADKLKEISVILSGADPWYFYTQKGKQSIVPKWGITGREFLQLLGTNAIRNHFHQDAWIISTLKSIENIPYVAIPDLRFKNEYEALKEKGAILIRIERPGIINKSNHISETSLDSFAFDYTIYNRGTLEEYHDVVSKFIIRNILREELVT